MDPIFVELMDPIYVAKLPGGWVLPFKMLSEESSPYLTAKAVPKHERAPCMDMSQTGRTQLNDTVLCLSRMAGSVQASCTVREQLACLRMSVLPPSLSDICQALSLLKKLLGGRVQLAKANHRRLFWSVHMAPHSPELAGVAIRVLSAHVTIAAAERNWSIFGLIFSKTRNRLALESAKKIAYIRGNSNAGMKVEEEVVIL